jgi:hypothetical protein
LLQPLEPNEIKHLNEDELEMAKEIEGEIKFESEISEERLDKEDSEWITEL